MTALFDFVFEIYDLFDFSDVRVYLSTRPEKAMGDPEVWEHAEAVLARCLDDRQDLNYTVKPGEGAFYGPKIDFDIHDALGRSWQLATIQLDFQMPERFDLTYVDSDGSEKRPVMIHRAILGSLERFYAVMLEHFGGDLPPWLAPEQARVLPVTDGVNDYAEGVASGLRARGLRVEVDRRSEKLGYKIRDGETQKVPYLLVVGQREAENDTVSLRLRHRRDEGVRSVDEVADRITNAVNTRSLEL
jgi:threonyl-tRNA synthetase